MTPDEQEFRSIHYLHRGYRIVPLSSGHFAVAEALPSSTLLAIVPTAEEALAILLTAKPSKGARHDPDRSHSEISDSDLGGIEISLF